MMDVAKPGRPAKDCDAVIHFDRLTPLFKNFYFRQNLNFVMPESSGIHYLHEVADLYWILVPRLREDRLRGNDDFYGFVNYSG